MDKFENGIIEVECNVRKNHLFIEGFEYPYRNKLKIKDGNIVVKIKPNGFYLINPLVEGGYDTVLECDVIYNNLAIDTVYYSVIERKFTGHGWCISRNSSIDYCTEVFMQYPYKYGKRVNKIENHYKEGYIDIKDYNKKDPYNEYRHSKNLLISIDHFGFSRSECMRLAKNNIFIFAYINARKYLNKGAVNPNEIKELGPRFKEPTYSDFIIELSKLETRLRNHGIDIPHNDMISSAFECVHIITDAFNNYRDGVRKMIENIKLNKRRVN